MDLKYFLENQNQLP